MSIRVLSADTAAKIAAGEVIVRPASAVKELIENALDAGTRRIEIYLENGGRNLIRLSDSGEGIMRDEIELAVERFATSKLKGVQDLERISSYGFRGEALASMAEVSELTIESQRADEESGVLLRVKAGEILERKEIVRTPGTTVTVANLFFNLPARRSFLRSESYERRLVLDVVKSYALLHYNIHIEVSSEREKLLVFTPAGDWLERIADVYPSLESRDVIRFKQSHSMLAVEGILLHPDQTKETGRVQKIFFNGRPVLYRSAFRAVVESFGASYGGYTPFFILRLESPPGMLDANIHPAKTEVRYRDERFLFDFVSQAIRKAVEREAAQTLNAIEPLARTDFGHPDSEASSGQLPLDAPLPPDQSTGGIEEEFLGTGRLTDSSEGPVGFWQLKNSYIMAQVPSGLIVVDQHAAHERILFEEMLERLGNHHARQPLLFPLLVELQPEEYATFEIISEELGELGLDVKPFGKNEVIVEAFPADARMSAVELAELFREFNADREVKLGNRERMAALIACKAAIKFGRVLSQHEMGSLINRLFSCKTPFFCPHGRPTVIKFTMEDLDKRFGRI